MLTIKYFFRNNNIISRYDSRWLIINVPHLRILCSQILLNYLRNIILTLISPFYVATSFVIRYRQCICSNVNLKGTRVFDEIRLPQVTMQHRAQLRYQPQSLQKVQDHRVTGKVRVRTSLSFLKFSVSYSIRGRTAPPVLVRVMVRVRASISLLYACCSRQWEEPSRRLWPCLCVPVRYAVTHQPDMCHRWFRA